MPRYELSISPNYVPDWTAVDAVREIFQNALDQQTVNPSNEMRWSYEDETFTISSKDSRLSRESLLFGITTKDKDKNLIGQFGEGYKLAFLVLSRLGFSTEVQNYAEKERWIPRIIKSKRYNSDLLVVDVEKFLFKRVPDHNLTFTIKGIPPETFEEIRLANLHMLAPQETFPVGNLGRILFDPERKGAIFVNGLFVCREETFSYGYDIHPEHLTIGRDRKLVSSFDLRWITSRVWAVAGLKDPDRVDQMISLGVPDVCYIDNHGGSSIKKLMEERFVSKYGERGIPVSSQQELELIQKKYPRLTPILVSSIHRDTLNLFASRVRDANYDPADEKSPEEILQEFKEKHEWSFNSDCREAFEYILKTSKRWIWE